ncbi:MAG: SLAP domain-containing protein [Clostridium sp.]|uniref:SLAP domain-containing protein n=1 Tax=Clostridium sp. TaxID=1506 RepID=UPI0030616136
MPSIFEKLFKKPEDIATKLEESIIDGVGETLPLQFDYGTSDFKKNLLYNEYKKIDKISVSDYLSIETVNIYHGYEGVEAQVFITNTSSTSVELHNVPLGLLNQEGKLVADKVIDFKGDYRIKGNSSFYYEVLFEGVTMSEEIKDLKVVFSSLYNTGFAYTKDMDIDSFIDDNLPRDTKEFIREKLYDIPSIRQGEFIIDPIVAIGQSEGIVALVLLRNGSNRDVTISSLPISVFLEGDILVYKGSHALEDKGILVEKNKGKLIDIRIPKGYIYGEAIEDYIYNLKVK